MTFWSGEKLLANRRVISDFSPDQVDCNSYTLRMGNCYYRTADRETGHEQKKTFLSEGESFLIPAGQFAYLMSKEEIKIPRHAMAFISMRTSIKFRGLINVSGFHVDPGYEGKLIYAVYNASPSPIQICENDKVFKIWFCDIDDTSTRIYEGQPFNDISDDVIKGMSKEIFSLQSIADKMRNLEQTMNTKLAGVQPAIDGLNFIWRAIIVGVVLAGVAFLLPTLSQSGQHVAQILWPAKSATAPPPVPPPTR
jgi:dCTP deaminase